MKEGFWSSENKPRARKRPWRGRGKFLLALKRMEAKAHGHRYKGWSCCRLCKANGPEMGDTTFEFGGWKWPQGFGHYVSKHNLKPTDAFREFVIGKRID